MTATESSPSPLAHWANADIPRAPSVNFFAARSAALSARLAEPRPLRLTLLSSPTARRAAQRRERVLVRKRHIAITPSPHGLHVESTCSPNGPQRAGAARAHQPSAAAEIPGRVFASSTWP